MICKPHYVKRGILTGLAAILLGFSLSYEDPSFGEYIEPIPGTNECIEMVPVPGGTFTMYDAESSASLEVKVDSFWIGKYEITWNLYNQFRDATVESVVSDSRYEDISADAISIPSPAYVDMTNGMGSDGYPAISMTHYAAHMFTRWLTAKTGEFYRLPTEAEWEYACRAGQNDEYSPPSDEELERKVWHRGNSDRAYQKVDTKEPNEFGIYNMLGNVSEWTADQYHENYLEEIASVGTENPWLKPTKLYPRSVRGGSWTEPASEASCLKRRGSQPRWKMHDPQLPKSLWWHTNAPFLGFRVVKPKNQPESAEEMEQFWIEEMHDYN